MANLGKLSPHIVWEIFDEITKIPRASKKEEAISQFLIAFAKQYNMKWERDKTGNILIRSLATQGMEGSPTVVLQSHMDMVCEKNSNTVFDFDADPISTILTDDGWVKADGTTLGADCGIGMAAALALLISPSIEHPPIEALFTVDEETGLTGAFGLSPNLLTGKYLINLDSEDEGEIFIGCAGGVDTIATFYFKPRPAPKDYQYFRFDIFGLLGGHSGDDIEKGRANSNKLAARFISTLYQQMPLSLADFDGGNLRNAIPREAYAVVGVSRDNVEEVKQLFSDFELSISQELKHNEPNFKTELMELPVPEFVVEDGVARKLVGALMGVCNGVQAMSFAMKGLVESSTNLASVKMAQGNKMVVTTSQRSAIESAKWNVAAAVNAIFTLAGADVKHSDGYPGWNPDPSSHLLAVTKISYEGLFGNDPKVRAIHAGLECGLFLEKYPHLEMVSFGPTIKGAHSPDERLEIASVDKFWELLIDVLSRLKE